MANPGLENWAQTIAISKQRANVKQFWFTLIGIIKRVQKPN